MEKSQEEQKKEEAPRKTMSLKFKILAFLLLVVLSIFAYGYFWYSSTEKIRVEAQGLINKANEFDKLSAEIEKERNRCENFITQQEGDFGSFEYCKKYIEWSNLR